MRRFWLVALGLLVGGGLGTLSMVTAAHREGTTAGALHAAGAVAIVVGILMLLAGLAKNEGPPFDPDARIHEHEWSNEEQAWTLGEALGMALWAVKKTPGRLAMLALGAPVAASAAVAVIGAGVAMLTIGLVPGIIGTNGAAKPTTMGDSRYVLLAISTCIAALAVVGQVIMVASAPVMKLCLACLRADKVTFADSASFLKHIPRLAVFGLLYGLLIVASAPLLAMPAIPFVLTPFFILDQDLPVGAAMRRSWRAASPHFGKLWLFHVACIPLVFIGSATVVGMLLTVPLFYGGLAYVYVRCTGRVGMPYFPPEAGSRFIRGFLRLSLLALTATFAGLIYWVSTFPPLRGSAWNIREFAVRLGAIVSEVLVTVVLLSLLLPYVLDQLEGRRFTSFVAARHVRSQKSGFLTVISILSICGVAISSCALSSVVSVMGGFSQDLRRKILGSGAHIVVDTTAGTSFEDYGAALERIRGIKGVVGATPVVRGEVMASSASNIAGVVVTGVEPESILSVIDLASNIEVGRFNYLVHPDLLTRLPASEVIGIGPGGERYYKGSELPGVADDIDPAVRAVILPSKPDRPGIILGRELAKTLHVYIGDEVTLVSPLGDLGPMGVMPRTKRFRVAAMFYSGMYEYDATFVYTMMDVAQDYFQTKEKISAIEVKVEPAEKAHTLTPEVVTALGREDLRVRDWREINKNLFSALQLERFATFIILSVAIIVASFCIVCTLLLMVTEKGKEIAILKAIGASDGAILRTFIIEGIIIGGIGTIFGVVTSLAVCTGVSWFKIILDPDVYYIDKLPISVDPIDFISVALAALTITTLSTLYPAYAASQLRPVDGLRDA